MEIEQRVSTRMHSRLPSARRVAVRLFSMDGTPLGEAAGDTHE